jgi:PAS domain S-box-containing protein
MEVFCVAEAGQHKSSVGTGWWWGYAVAVVGTVVAALVHWALERAVGGLPLYITFYPVVFAAALMAGTGAGLLATALSLFTAHLLFTEPVGKLEPVTMGQAVAMVLYVAINVGLCILAGRLRRKSEALRESEARLQMAQQVSHMGAFEWNVQSGVDTWSPGLETMYGLKPGEFGGTESAWEKLVHPEDRAKAVAAVDRALETLQPQEVEWRVVWPDGTVHWLVGRCQAFRDETGRPLRVVGVNIDITDRKRAEEELRRSEERFRSMANAIPQLAWIARPDGYIFWFNRRVYEYTGATLEQLEGWAWTSYHDQKVLPSVVEQWRRSLADGEPFDMEFPLRRADGQFRTFLTRIMPLKGSDGRVSLWFGTHTDITDRKQNEAEIVSLRDRLAADLVGMNRLQALSARFVRQGELQPLLDAILEASIALTGADKGHVQLFDLASGKPEIKAHRGFDRAFFEYAEHVRPGVLAAGVVLQTRQRVIVEDVAASPLYRDSPRARELVLGAGMRAIVATPLLTRTNQLLGTLSVLFGVPYHPIDRDLRLFDLLARQAADSIERTKSEEALRAARQQLASANASLEQKVEERTAEVREAMAELEHMSYSMVHDMRAPLRAMDGFAQILQHKGLDSRQSPGLEYLGRIRESANRLDRMITDALNYSKVVREHLPMAPVDLGKLLRGMVQTYPNLQPPADIAIELTDVVVLGNESLLTQCFGNLLDNAVKFVAPGVKPRIRVWAQDGPTPAPATAQKQGQGEPSASRSTRDPASPAPPQTAHPPSLSPSQFVLVWVEDKGIGIPEEAQENIFRMFHRVHSESQYPGTGIGLAIVKKAVQRMGGRVCLDSEPGKGTRVCVQLRRAAQAGSVGEGLEEAA